MMIIPDEFCKQISAFAPMFSRKVFKHVQTLLMAGTPVGSLLVVGRRTICSALRAVGREREKQFHKYHRVLSKAKCSARQGSPILLDLLINTFIPSSDPLIFGIDETMGK